MIDKIKQAAVDTFGSFRQYAIHFETYSRNFELRIVSYIDKLQKWLEPLGYQIVLKKKSSGKK
jgi:hypothetical protein